MTLRRKESEKMVRAIECTGKNELSLSEYPLPETEPGCVLLKVLACGVCGTDLHGIAGKREIAYPFIPGHEMTAVVEAVGDGAGETIKLFGADRLEKGLFVTINPRITCGHCFFCKEMPSQPQKCLNAKTATSVGSKEPPHLFGGFAEYFYALPGSELIALPKGLDAVTGTLVEPFSCAVGLVDRHRRSADTVAGSGFEITDPVVVYGAGAIGILMMAAFKSAGAQTIIAVDIDTSRLVLATEFGASHCINSNNMSAEERISEIRGITDGLGAGIIVEACGVPSLIGEGVHSLRRGGKLYEVGHLLKTEDACVDPFYICRNEIEILGNYAYPSSNTMRFAAELLSRGSFPYEKLVRAIPFGQGADAIINNKLGNAIKPVLVME